ncbi:MAG: carbohydrate-binding protein [Paludibacteraceae bacterium]|nr:carbohydrate-binding protein [Paludibacteraceae bacterium]
MVKKVIKVLVLLTLATLTTATSAAPATCLNGKMKGFGATPPIHVEGNKLMDDCGHQVVLHGVMDTPNGYFNGNFSRWAFDWGKEYDAPSAIPNVMGYFNKIFTVLSSQDKGVYCNVFRLHMDPCWTNDRQKPLVGQGGEHNISQFSADRLRYFLDNLYFPLAKEAIKHGMYVIMRPPGVCPENIKVGDEYNQYLNTVWDIVSSHDSIKKYAGVISLELANEPVRLYDKNGKETEFAPWAPHDFFQPILETIRNNGFKGIVWGAGTGYQSQYGGYKNYPLVDPLNNLGYACHVYTGWYGNADEYGNTQHFIDQFKKQVPVVETNPVVVTECDWSPGHVVGTNSDGSLKSKNLGTWATGSTSKWGNRFKAVMDKYNLSLTLTGTDDYVDMEHYLKTGEIRYAFYGKEGAEDACGKACWDWYKEYAKVNYGEFCDANSADDPGNSNNPGGSDCDEKENFQIYLAFGQSNMWGNAKVENSDKVAHPRVKKMITVNGSDLYSWQEGMAPYAAPNGGYSMCDQFAKTLANTVDENVTIGMICVAIPGASIKAFDPAQYQQNISTGPDWLQNYAKSYGGNPYQRLLDCAKKAQEKGVIKGMIFHQGESDWGYGDWSNTVAKLFKSLCKDLGIDPNETGFVMGELTDGGGRERMDAVARQLAKCIVVDSDGLPAESDGLHFTHAAYETLGKRYAEAMKKLVPMDGCSGTSTPKVSTPYKGVAAQIPGVIEAENYDEGGSRVAWYDKSSGNECDGVKNTYRSDDVDIKKDGNGYVVGSCQEGEWMKYTVNVVASGDYKIEGRVGEGAGSGKFTLLMDGEPLAVCDVESTGEWGQYSIQSFGKVSLTEGEHLLTLRIDQDWVDFDWIRFVDANSTGVENVADNRIEIVPNPAIASVMVVANGDVQHVEVVNMLGKSVLSTTSATIDVSSLTAGVYLVKATVNEVVVVKRLVVVK